MSFDLCRLCANTSPINHLTVRISDSLLNIEEKLIACCQWDKYKGDDDLPDAMCDTCYETLHKCWLFSESIARAQEKLRQIYRCNDQTTTVKLEVKTEETDLNLSETELEHVHIFVEPIKLEKPSPSKEASLRDVNHVKRSKNVSTAIKTTAVKKHHIPQTTPECTTNSSELKYACNECGRRFRLRCTRNAHRFVHTNERNFECWLCHRT